MQSSRLETGRPRFTVPDKLVGPLTILILILTWELAVRAGWLNPYYFPPPSKQLDSLWKLVTDGFPRGVTVFGHIQATITRITGGYALATITAIPLGLLIGSSRLLTRASMPIVTFARSIATISLLPLMVAWFGVGELTRILLIFFGCFWIILTNTIYGVSTVDPVLIRAARTLGAAPRQMFFRVVLPASLPRIFSGMKVALGLSFLVIVAVEMIGTIKGLGALIMEARTYYRTEMTMVGMLIIAMFGLLLSKGLDRLEKWLLPWAVGIDEVER